MLRGLGKLTWIEIKIFLREPLGAIGTIVVPVLVFVVVGRVITAKAQSPSMSSFARVGLPVMVSILIVISTVLSLVTIISIYREGGILKRLRATPLRPQTILSAHVLVKLLLTAASLLLMFLAGKRYIPPGVHPPIVLFRYCADNQHLEPPVDRFCHRQHCSYREICAADRSVVLYPMVGLSGLFVPVASFPPAIRALAHASPMTYAVSLLQGIWVGDAWSAHLGDVAALIVFFLLFTAVSVKIFRWE